MQVEITQEIPLKPQTSALLDMHSLYNLINIITGELQILEMLTEDPDLVRDSMKLCFKIKRNLTDVEQAVSFAEDIDEYINTFMHDIGKLLAIHPSRSQYSEIMESCSNLKSVINILRTRAEEILERYKEPDKWKKYQPGELMQSFLDVFEAIEKNSKGRYRFVYNLAKQEDQDYFISLTFESADRNSIYMPPVFQDIMRDLLANARKYSDPGGTIIAGLLDDGKHLRFSVQDTGIGIPSSEIEKVVEFGFRASNVGDRRTMGGGFGLTKAYCITKQAGGKMWISSEVNQGTRIKIIIPRP